MSRKTDDLIEALAADLTPVRPLRPPVLRATWWISGAVIYIAILMLAGTESGITVDDENLAFVIVQLLGALAGMLAATAAFVSVVPGRSRRVPFWAATAAGGWVALMLFWGLGSSQGQSIFAAQHEWICVAFILIGGAPLVAVLSIMLRRGAPLHPGRTAVFAGLAVGLLASFGACLSRPHALDMVTLAWHGGAMLALIIVCIAGARFVLRWNSR